MELKEFIENFSGQFEESDIENIHEDVNFKLLDTWDSLTSMSIQVMIEDEYNVQVTPGDLNEVVTVRDLFTIVKSRLNA